MFCLSIIAEKEKKGKETQTKKKKIQKEKEKKDNKKRKEIFDRIYDTHHPIRTPQNYDELITRRR